MGHFNFCETPTSDRSTRRASRSTGRWIGVVVGLVLTMISIDVVATTPATTQAAGDSFVPVTPTRVLDTRTDIGGHPGTVGPGETFSLDLSDVVPSTATAVVINVTSTRATSQSFVTIWPSGAEQPVTASLNLEPGQDTPNLVIVGLGQRSIDIYNDSGTTHLVGDVTGWFEGSSELVATTPTRLLDTRTGVGGTVGPVFGGSTFSLKVAGTGGVPTSATSVVLNVTSTAATSPSYVTVYPSGAERPLAATLNTDPGQATPNLTIARVGTNGSVDIFVSAGSTHLTADVMGYFDPGDRFVASTPTRVLDTRSGVGAAPDPVGAGQQIDLEIAGVGSIPSDAVAVVLNITSSRSTERSYVTAWPAGEPRPLAASLNTEPGQDTPNLAVLKLGETGALSLYNRHGSTHLIADVVGWFLAPVAEPQVLDLTDRSRATLSGTGGVDDNGITSDGGWSWNTTTRKLTAWTASSAFATAEDFDAWAFLRADFSPYTSNAVLEIDLEWWGTMTSFVGASALAEMDVYVRLRRQTTSGYSTVWDWHPVDDGIGSGLKALEVLKVEDSEVRTFTMPELAVDGTRYRMEVELRCRTKVVFSIGATACDANGGERGLTVNDWSLTFT